MADAKHVSSKRAVDFRQLEYCVLKCRLSRIFIENLNGKWKKKKKSHVISSVSLDHDFDEWLKGTHTRTDLETIEGISKTP